MAARLLLGSGCFVWAVFSLNQTCSDFGAVQHDTDTSGELLAKIYAQSVDDCCALCSQRADCDGYVFHLDHCYLKKNLGASTTKLHAMTRVKSMKKSCCGDRCYPEYDPETEKCCGEDEDMPVVCPWYWSCRTRDERKYDRFDVADQPQVCPPFKRCCHGRYCSRYGEVYDTRTEQCCGEGKWGMDTNPTICSKDSGCCESLFTHFPKCFDVRTQQCCGANRYGHPIVCGTGDTCPSDDVSYQCPWKSFESSASLRGAALGGVATSANYSSAEEPSFHLLP